MEIARVWMLFTVVAILVAAVGVVLARSADRIGEAFRLDRSIIGFMLLAAATSLPELVVSCQLARSGLVDMAVGGLLGSCLINLMILAVIDLSRWSTGRMLTRKLAAHALSGLASIFLAAIAAVAVLVPAMPSFGRLHLGSLLLLLGYLATVRLIFVDGIVSRAADVVESADVEAEALADPPPKRRPVVLYLAGTFAIFLLASPLATTSNSLAVVLGLSGTFFGALFLALITSLPEMVTTYESSRIGADDMAIGNILGSNAFNLLILVAVDIASPLPLFSSLENMHAVTAIGIILTTSVATMGILYHVEKRIWFGEPDAFLVILMSLLFYFILYVG